MSGYSLYKPSPTDPAANLVYQITYMIDMDKGLSVKKASCLMQLLFN